MANSVRVKNGTGVDVVRILTTADLAADAGIVGTQLAAGAAIAGSQLAAAAGIALTQIAAMTTGYIARSVAGVNTAVDLKTIIPNYIVATGTATLVTGTIAVALADIKADDVVLFSRSSVASSTALGGIDYAIVVDTTLTFTSKQMATPASTETGDLSVIYYVVIRALV